MACETHEVRFAIAQVEEKFYQPVETRGGPKASGRYCITTGLKDTTGLIHTVTIPYCGFKRKNFPAF